MKIPTAADLDGYVNKHISEICGCSFIKDDDKHCAHFVCHATELRFGLTCFGITGKGSRNTGANIRVQEVFPQCRRVGRWSDKPADLTKGFIFTTQTKNVDLKNKTISNVPRKHIGIFIDIFVWQYKNRLRHVIRQNTSGVQSTLFGNRIRYIFRRISIMKRAFFKFSLIGFVFVFLFSAVNAQTKKTAAKIVEPTAKEAIRQVLLNGNILLSAAKNCESMGTSLEDRTIFDFLSGILSFQAMPESTNR